jgi:hypothetical protein
MNDTFPFEKLSFPLEVFQRSIRGVDTKTHIVSDCKVGSRPKATD